MKKRKLLVCLLVFVCLICFAACDNTVDLTLTIGDTTNTVQVTDDFTFPTQTEKVGYTLKWYKDEVFTQPFNLEEYVKNPTTLSIYGRYEANTYTVKTSVDAVVTDNAYTMDAEFALAEPTKTGYTFAGWFTDAECTKAFDLAAYKANPSDLTVYAKFNCNHESCVYTDLEDGKNHTKKCDTCGEVITEAHNYGEWIIDVEATYDKVGSKHRVCACGHKQTEVIAKQNLKYYFDKNKDIIDNNDYGLTYQYSTFKDLDKNSRVYEEIFNDYPLLAVDDAEFVFDDRGEILVVACSKVEAINDFYKKKQNYSIYNTNFAFAMYSYRYNRNFNSYYLLDNYVEENSIVYDKEKTIIIDIKQPIDLVIPATVKDINRELFDYGKIKSVSVEPNGVYKLIDHCLIKEEDEDKQVYFVNQNTTVLDGMQSVGAVSDSVQWIIVPKTIDYIQACITNPNLKIYSMLTQTDLDNGAERLEGKVYYYSEDGIPKKGGEVNLWHYDVNDKPTVWVIKHSIGEPANLFNNEIYGGVQLKTCSKCEVGWFNNILPQTKKVADTIYDAKDTTLTKQQILDKAKALYKSAQSYQIHTSMPIPTGFADIDAYITPNMFLVREAMDGVSVDIAIILGDNNKKYSITNEAGSTYYYQVSTYDSNNYTIEDALLDSDFDFLLGMGMILEGSKIVKDSETNETYYANEEMDVIVDISDTEIVINMPAEGSEVVPITISGFNGYFEEAVLNEEYSAIYMPFEIYIEGASTIYYNDGDEIVLPTEIGGRKVIGWQYNMYGNYVPFDIATYKANPTDITLEPIFEESGGSGGGPVEEKFAITIVDVDKQVVIQKISYKYYQEELSKLNPNYEYFMDEGCTTPISLEMFKEPNNYTVFARPIQK